MVSTLELTLLHLSPPADGVSSNLHNRALNVPSKYRNSRRTVESIVSVGETSQRFQVLLLATTASRFTSIPSNAIEDGFKFILHKIALHHDNKSWRMIYTIGSAAVEIKRVPSKHASMVRRHEDTVVFPPATAIRASSSLHHPYQIDTLPVLGIGFTIGASAKRR